MKNNDSYKRSAVMHTFFTFYTVHELAEKISEISKDCVNVELDVYNTKTDGFILRKRKDTIIGNQSMIKLMRKAIKAIIQLDSDGFSEYMEDQHDCVYSDEYVTDDMIEEFFTINKNGRLYTIEIDMP